MTDSFQGLMRRVGRTYTAEYAADVLDNYKKLRAMFPVHKPAAPQKLTPRQLAAKLRRDKALRVARRQVRSLLRKYPELSSEFQEDD